MLGLRTSRQLPPLPATWIIRLESNLGGSDAKEAGGSGLGLDKYTRLLLLYSRAAVSYHHAVDEKVVLIAIRHSYCREPVIQIGNNQSSMDSMAGHFIHHIDPVIGQIGGMYLWWYGLSYSLGFLGLFHWLRTMRNSLGLDVREVYDLTILTAAGVLIGGRFVEVVFYEWSYYGAHPARIPWLWLGGMSTHGILLGGTLGAWLFCRLYHKSFLALADELVVAAAFIMGLGRLGNFVDGQIVGDVTNAWWAVKFPDAEGFRHPVVLYDGLKNLLLVPVLILLKRHHPPRGLLLGVFLFGYGFFRIFIDFFREYRSDLFGLPPGQEFNIGMSMLGVALVVWALKSRHPGGMPLTTSAIASGLNMDVRKSTRIRRLVLRGLLIIPLVIPSDWTQDVPNRYGKRHQGMAHTQLYPRVGTDQASD